MMVPIYTKLDQSEIRILGLSPGLSQTPLHGRLIIRSLKSYIEALENATTDDHPEVFESLSYSWESSARNCPFTTPAGTVQIAAPLELALRRLRLQDRERLIWADGVCINQDDWYEREQQVRVMGDIYRVSQRTLVFLGDQGDNSSAGIKMLISWWKYYIAPYGFNGRTVKETEERLGMAFPPQPDVAEPPPPASDPAWIAARKIWLRPWFQRLWVVQEFVLARDVTIIYGEVSIPWQYLWLVTMNKDASRPGDTWLGEPDVYDTVVSFSTLGSLRVLYRQSGYKNTLSLADLITFLPGRFASEQLDYFYSILGMAVDSDRAEFQPDYRSSPNKVISRIGQCLLRQTCGPKLLARAGLGGLRLDIPSWAAGVVGPTAPVWPLTYEHFAGVPDYRAAGSRPFEPQWDDDVLMLFGTYADTVKDVFKLEERKTFLPNSYGAFQNAQLQLKDADFDIAVARTLIADKFIAPTYGESAERPDDKALLLSFTYSLLRKQGHPDADAFTEVCTSLGFSESDATRRVILNFENSYNCMRDRHDLFPCVTRTGRPGMLSRFCEPDDQVWLIAGCPCPIILRPSAKRPDHFKVLGNAYIFGVMYEEALTEEVDCQIVRLD